MGKVIVIESNTDGAGKQTQTQKLYDYLKEQGKKVVKFSFPNYDSYSSYFVKKYLNGEISKDAKSINPYLASTFYALDRALTFNNEIKKYYDDDYIILFDRYVTSNMVYQASKLKNTEEIKEFINWEKDLEYLKYNLPVPDKTIFLNIPIEVSQELIRKRENKFSGKDIHESDLEFLKNASNTANIVAKLENWITVNVTDENNCLKSIDEIFDMILYNINDVI